MNLEPILAPTHAVTRRIRLARALRAGATTFALGTAGIALGLAASGLGWLSGGDLRVVVALGVGAPLVLTVAAAARVLPALLPAEILDRSHALGGRLTTALELGAAKEPSPLAALAIDDAVARARDVSPARAFPIRLPADARALALALASLLVASTLRPPGAPPREPPPPARLAPLLVHADDLALERDALREIETQSDPTPELRVAIDETNALLEALEDRSLGRTEALRELSQLTERLERPRPSALTAREDALRELGDRLGRGEATAELARALREADADGAQEALHALADRLREHGLSAAERRRLQEALAEARASEPETDLLQRTEDAERSVAEAEAMPESEEQERLLEQRQREVEQLREEHARRMEAERELERLERELGDLANPEGDAEAPDPEEADALDEAAEDLNRMARDQQSEEQMRQLAQQLRQLREMIRRQREQRGGDGEDGEGGSRSGGQGSQRSGSGRMDRFVLRAGGGEDGSGGVRIGMRQGGGADGDGQTEGSQGQGGQDDEGTPGGTSGSAQGSDGEGGGPDQAGEEPRMLVLGDEGGDAMLELPGFGQSGRGSARGSGDGDGEGGQGAGTGHDPSSLADPTGRGGDHRTVAVHGEDRGRGPSRSEVIRGGAARGFASRDYERVYAEYEAHAERAIEEDQIPPGYRFYVRRYFDLIRPRD